MGFLGTPPPKEKEPALAFPLPFSGETVIPPLAPLKPGRVGRGGDSEVMEEKMEDMDFAVAVIAGVCVDPLLAAVAGDGLLGAAGFEASVPEGLAVASVLGLLDGGAPKLKVDVEVLADFDDSFAVADGREPNGGSDDDEEDVEGLNGGSPPEVLVPFADDSASFAAGVGSLKLKPEPDVVLVAEAPGAPKLKPVEADLLAPPVGRAKGLAPCVADGLNENVLADSEGSLTGPRLGRVAVEVVVSTGVEEVLPPNIGGSFGAEVGAGLPEPPRRLGSGLITLFASSFGVARWNSRGPSEALSSSVSRFSLVSCDSAERFMSLLSLK